MRKTIEAIVEHGKARAVANLGLYVKEIFTPHFKIETLTQSQLIIPIRKKEPDFFEQLDLYKLSKEKKLVSTAVIGSLKERLLQFQTFTKQPISFSSLDYNFYMEFVDFLTYD
jgi:hypothetical protein